MCGRLRFRNRTSKTMVNRTVSILTLVATVARDINDDQIGDIVYLQLDQVRRRLEERKITLVVTPAAIDRLGLLGYDPVFGARPLKRVIAREVVDRLALSYTLLVAAIAIVVALVLRRPLLDATFMPGSKGKPVLAALHTADSFLARDPNCEERFVMTYRWNGFGFSGIRESRGERRSDSLVYARGKLRLLQKGRITGEIPQKTGDSGTSLDKSQF